ncbi:hypothetical protein U1Q18_051980 [Sarracenia purpurea var. burkii]
MSDCYFFDDDAIVVWGCPKCSAHRSYERELRWERVPAASDQERYEDELLASPDGETLWHAVKKNTGVVRRMTAAQIVLGYPVPLDENPRAFAVDHAKWRQTHRRAVVPTTGCACGKVSMAYNAAHRDEYVPFNVVQSPRWLFVPTDIWAAGTNALPALAMLLVAVVTVVLCGLVTDAKLGWKYEQAATVVVAGAAAIASVFLMLYGLWEGLFNHQAKCARERTRALAMRNKAFLDARVAAPLQCRLLLRQRHAGMMMRRDKPTKTHLISSSFFASNHDRRRRGAKPPAASGAHRGRRHHRRHRRRGHRRRLCVCQRRRQQERAPGIRRTADDAATQGDPVPLHGGRQPQRRRAQRRAGAARPCARHTRRRGATVPVATVRPHQQSHGAPPASLSRGDKCLCCHHVGNLTRPAPGGWVVTFHAQIFVWTAGGGGTKKRGVSDFPPLFCLFDMAFLVAATPVVVCDTGDNDAISVRTVSELNPRPAHRETARLGWHRVCRHHGGDRV